MLTSSPRECGAYPLDVSLKLNYNPSTSARHSAKLSKQSNCARSLPSPLRVAHECAWAHIIFGTSVHSKRMIAWVHIGFRQLVSPLACGGECVCERQNACGGVISKYTLHRVEGTDGSLGTREHRLSALRTSNSVGANLSFMTKSIMRCQIGDWCS